MGVRLRFMTMAGIPVALSLVMEVVTDAATTRGVTAVTAVSGAVTMRKLTTTAAVTRVMTVAGVAAAQGAIDAMADAARRRAVRKAAVTAATAGTWRSGGGCSAVVLTRGLRSGQGLAELEVAAVGLVALGMTMTVTASVTTMPHIVWSPSYQIDVMDAPADEMTPRTRLGAGMGDGTRRWRAEHTA